MANSFKSPTSIAGSTVSATDKDFFVVPTSNASSDIAINVSALTPGALFLIFSLNNNDIDSFKTLSLSGVSGAKFVSTESQSSDTIDLQGACAFQIVCKSSTEYLFSAI